MKNILVMLVLVVMLVGFTALNFIAPVSGIYTRVSDSVTARDRAWPTPVEQAKGQKALDQMIEQNK